MPYGEQRYNEHLHLLGWSPKDSRTKLYANIAPLPFLEVPERVCRAQGELFLPQRVDLAVQSPTSRHHQNDGGCP